MKCNSGNKSWPVYGNSSTAGLIIGSGCVTLAPPNVAAGQEKIICSGTCDEIKGWMSAGDPTVKLLDHEACHACAYEDSGKCKYLWTWAGDMWGYCDKNKITSTPMW